MLNDVKTERLWWHNTQHNSQSFYSHNQLPAICTYFKSWINTVACWITPNIEECGHTCTRTQSHTHTGRKSLYDNIKTISISNINVINSCYSQVTFSTAGNCRWQKTDDITNNLRIERSDHISNIITTLLMWLTITLTTER